ncbi:hypothetical protein BDW71DRAFT_184761 [Aspergillus fruticulosus]
MKSRNVTYINESDTRPEPPANSEDGLDNEGRGVELYWIYLMEYETRQLRRLYNASMRQIHPGWDSQVEDVALKQDFSWALFICGHGYSLKRIAQWVDGGGRGKVRG